MSDSIRRNMAVFPMSVVMKLTELSARQIRYYESQSLITPERTRGNQRLFSMNDLDLLLDIKLLLEKGFNMKRIKSIIAEEKSQQPTFEIKESLDYEVTKLDRSTVPINRGDLSRFFK
ncbi:MerR family transcriptional regulator [Macrococcus armenti]|uniref:MerR family transcriptional regulator n=1 Tax=Macrococcus armenti TaxID=2875764 RepID=A0ABY3ZX75_9STAP|nr:MerR family transcriptional regulator [Macrococcus armenti]UBH09611.1 MerR family transcriptional regulator [Macrococcus armenti]UBH11886.1 MerR family transcriptional regulator [Macrococcus armenti]UBH16362.1 MerR family transcriptional regulator [Macrococcus armenti]UBH18718.1 MerR family transcriptional regulator [Macrococcus armenti]UBH20990.1 MerR family transcriptional regulator [Macrococcus armenti]